MNCIFIHVDNAKLHLINDKFSELGIIRSSPSPYLPDLKPYNFYLNDFIINKLGDNTYLTEKYRLATLNNTNREIPKMTYKLVFNEFMRRL